MMNTLLDRYNKYILDFQSATKGRGEFHEIGRFSFKDQEVPLYGYQVGTGRKKVLITAGLHGEEQAGPLALVKFIENDLSKFIDSYSFTILPILNPVGFDKKQRRGSLNLDLNRYFKPGLSLPENAIVTLFLEENFFEIHFDLHEDVEEGTYLYLKGEDLFIRQGEVFLRKIAQEGVSILKNERLFGFTNNLGIINLSLKTNLLKFVNSGFLIAYLYLKAQTKSVLIFETSRKMHLEKRILLQVMHLKYWLENYSS